MGESEGEERAVEYLQNALDTDDIEEKNYYIRQALHLLAINTPAEEQLVN